MIVNKSSKTYSRVKASPLEAHQYELRRSTRLEAKASANAPPAVPQRHQLSEYYDNVSHCVVETGNSSVIHFTEELKGIRPFQCSVQVSWTCVVEMAWGKPCQEIFFYYSMSSSFYDDKPSFLVD